MLQLVRYSGTTEERSKRTKYRQLRRAIWRVRRADQQVRHLKREGWYIGPKAGRYRLDPYRVSQEFQNANARKCKRLTSGDFDSIKQAFSGRCATCGALEGQPDPRYGDDIVKLQQGYRDPHEGETTPTTSFYSASSVIAPTRAISCSANRAAFARRPAPGQYNGRVPRCRNSFSSGSSANSGRTHEQEENRRASTSRRVGRKPASPSETQHLRKTHRCCSPPSSGPIRHGGRRRANLQRLGRGLAGYA